MTFNEGYSTIVGNVAVEARRAEDAVKMRDISVDKIEAIRNSQSGVSLDEELTFMLAYQRAYQASARVINTTDQMISTILSLGAR
jgi:flagellar hook-associated protein 1 FlgK